MNLGELWTGVLDLVAQVIIPVWNDLIQYIPLLLGLLILVSLAGLAWAWQRNATGNRSRGCRGHCRPAASRRTCTCPARRCGPSWRPSGLLLIVFAVVFGLDQVANMVLLAIGVTIAGVGLLGWYLDANREYAPVEAASHGQLEAGLRGVARPAGRCSRRAGTHLPGPSAWPFLAPVGLAASWWPGSSSGRPCSSAAW